MPQFPYQKTLRTVISTPQRCYEDELSSLNQRESSTNSVLGILLGPWDAAVNRADKSLEFTVGQGS